VELVAAAIWKVMDHIEQLEMLPAV